VNQLEMTLEDEEIAQAAEAPRTFGRAASFAF